MPFVPLEQTNQRQGFIPLDDVDAANEGGVDTTSGVLRNVLLNNPLTAAGEAALNFGSQVIAIPAAGWVGMGSEATHALGITDEDPADTVRKVADAMTYQPRGEMGKGAAKIVAYPFEKLSEAGQYVGDKVLDATGSPVAATVADTAVNAVPMLFGAKGKRAKAGEIPKGAEVAAHEGGFVPLSEGENGSIEAGARRVAGNDSTLYGAETEGLEALRGSGDNGMPAVDGELQDVSRGHGASPDAAALAGQIEHVGELRAGELPLDAPTAPGTAPAVLPEGDYRRPGDDGSRSGQTPGTAEQELSIAPGPERLAPGESAIGETLPGLAMADIQGRDAAIARMGAEGRDSTSGAMAQNQEGLVDRTRIDDSQQARIAEAAELEQRLFPGGDLAPAHYRRATRDGAVQREVIEQARSRYDQLRQELGLPTTLEKVQEHGGAERAAWVFRPDDLPKASAENRPTVRPDNSEAAMNSWAPGANYAPLIDDALQSHDLPASAWTKPITREEVLGPFLKALGIPIYEGRVTGKRLGYYMPTRETLRIKRKSDLEVAAHELAHALDDRIPEIKKSWSEGKGWQAIRSELKGVSYDHKKTSEGFAEFVRLYMTQPEEAAKRAPTFNTWFDEFTKRHEYGPAILKAREGFTSWFGQSAVDRARSKIGMQKPINEALHSVWSKFRQSVSDDLHGIYRMERELTHGEIKPNGAYESARLSRASHSITDGSIRHGYPARKADGSVEFRGQGLEEILKPVADDLDNALLYFVGRSAQELMGQKREHLFTPGEIAGMVRLERPEFRKAFSEYQLWNKGILDFAESSGVVNPAARMMWQRQSYMPFHRIGQPGEFHSAKPGDWSGIKALTGGTENLKSILGNMVANAATLIDKSVKNEARLKVANLALKERGGGRFMQEIPKESRPVKISGEQILEAVLKTLGIDQKGSIGPAMRKTVARLREQIANAPEAFEFLMQQAPAGSSVVAILEGGKPRYFEVADPILMRALASIDRQHTSWLIKWLGLPKRVGQLAITLTPDFMIRNISRDTVMGAVMSRAGFRPVMDSLEGMRLRLTNDPIYKDYIANGGGMSSIYLDEHKFKADLERFYNRQGIDYKTVLDTPAKLLNAVETMADAFEMSTRLGEYKRAVEHGENPRHAAYLGREVSTDFAMRGDSKTLGLMYDTIMFLKPAVVSFDRLGRGLLHDPNRGAIATKAGLMALSSMTLYLANKDNPKYQDLADWDRDSYWHFFIGDQHFRFPKTWEIGAMASVAERTAEKTIAADPEGLGKDFVRILAATFDLNLKPQIVAPLYEQATNRNGFTGAPIETPGMENVQPFLRAKPSTSQTMKAAGMATRNLPESMQVNPVRAEALLRGYFNTWATYGLMLTDKAFFNDQLPTMRTDELPVVKSFYVQDPAKHTKYESMFYDMLNEAQRLHGTMRELDQMHRPDLADEKERSSLAGEAKPLERAGKNLQVINRDMEATRRDPMLSPDEKRKKLDSLTVERNALLKAAVTESKAIQKERQ